MGLSAALLLEALLIFAATGMAVTWVRRRWRAQTSGASPSAPLSLTSVVPAPAQVEATSVETETARVESTSASATEEEAPQLTQA